MSVYTSIGREELATWLEPLELGVLVEYAGISAGMQNSNYFVTTTQGRFVLTLFEHIATPALDFYLSLMAHLATRAIPCPHPLADAAGRSWRLLAGKPAALFTCLPGDAEISPSARQCHALGEMLAHLHHAGADMMPMLSNPCGPAWSQVTGAALLPLLAPKEQTLLADELAFQAAQDFSALPRGVIHADLFRDNVLWDGERLSGVLDFYFAGEDCLLFDLAVVANDWCLEPSTLSAFIAGYCAQRPLSPAERTAWPGLRRAAALRFWLLRLEVRHRPRGGEVVTIKDPEDFGRLLQRLRLAPEALPR